MGVLASRLRCLSELQPVLSGAGRGTRTTNDHRQVETSGPQAPEGVRSFGFDSSDEQCKHLRVQARGLGEGIVEVVLSMPNPLIPKKDPCRLKIKGKILFASSTDLTLQKSVFTVARVPLMFLLAICIPQTCSLFCLFLVLINSLHFLGADDT